MANGLAIGQDSARMVKPMGIRDVPFS